MLNPELYELLRKCLVMGGPLAEDAKKVIQTHYRDQEISFLYPHVLGENWQRAYR